MARRRGTRWRSRVFGAVFLAALLAGGFLWWNALSWQPERSQYPAQGVLIGEQDGAVDFFSLRGMSADFVYLEASKGAQGRDENFARNLELAAEAKLKHGVVHSYDPCAPAEKQAANFVTIVPRDPEALPPAIALDQLADTCDDPVVEAGVESELTTFINQVENHMGKPVVLKLSSEFEAEYAIAARIERNLWLARDFLEPDYAGRPWALWTANRHLRGSISEDGMRWVVVQP